ncbi:sulfate adenylyltransferase subunit 1 [Vibrio ishigakensis]|uniref:Sulfate adenylyltransferase subunit 1 n=1 Tax=Vibrio ishigakensis TaxID=1481914 RepID=A0A0B8PKR8_9VIBR|nr:sulfate adenylyltransferase subunit 1 [Vibrio ishigakensis]
MSRGDMLVHNGHEPSVTNKVKAYVVWMGENPMRTHKEYVFKFATKSCTGKVTTIPHKVDVNTLEKHAENSETLDLNEIALSDVALTDKIAVDTYHTLPQTGSFVVIDRHTNVTVGAGMVETVIDGTEEQGRVYSSAERELNAYVRKHFPEWGCSTI